MAERARAVVLGASNIERGLADLTAMARATLGPELDLYCAHGNGRSFGVSTRVLGRELSSIGTSELWAALESAPRVATRALVMDLGNDVAYGFTAAQIADWIERDLARLSQLGARTVLVLPPLASLGELPNWRFQLAKRVLFPGRPLELARVLAELRELALRAQALARTHAALVLEPVARDYGLDPIHLTRAGRRALFARVAQGWSAHAREPVAADVGERRAARRARPASCLRFGRERRCAQPSARLGVGTAIYWY